MSEDDKGEGVEVYIWQKSPEKSPEKQPQTGDSDSECSQLPVRADMEVPGESSIIVSHSQTLNGKLVWLCETNILGIDPKMIFFFPITACSQLRLQSQASSMSPDSRSITHSAIKSYRHEQPSETPLAVQQLSASLPASQCPTDSLPASQHLLDPPASQITSDSQPIASDFPPAS